MSQFPNILVQLGELLGPGGSIVVLLLLCAGAVWVVMAIRSNQADHARLEAKVDKGLERIEGKVDDLRVHLEGKVDDLRVHLEGKIDDGHVRLEGKIENSRNETRDDAKETRAELRSINSRLDQLIGGKPPDQPG